MKYIQERVFENDGYGLPLFLEKVEVPGFPKTYVRIYASEYTLDEIEKEYVIYSKHEYDDDGNVTVYASQLYRSTSGPVLFGIKSEEEWSRIRGVLRALSENGDLNMQDYLSPAKFDKDGIEIL